MKNIKLNPEERQPNFDNLPSAALVDIKVVCGLYSRSPASIWRDVKARLIPQPIRIGQRGTRWRVGDLRTALATLEGAA